MNELDLTNTQSVIFMVVLIGLLLLPKPPRPQKSAQFEREKPTDDRKHLARI